MTDGIGDSNDFIASYLFKDANNKDFQASFTNYQKGLFRALMKDEEGKIKELPRNDKATKLVDKIISPDDYLVGDVLITESKYIK